MSETIGDRIKYIRGNRSRTFLADKLGINLSKLVSWEKDETVPNCVEICRISGLGESQDISLGWIVTGTGYMYSQPPENNNKPQLVYLTDEEQQEKIFEVCAVLEGVVMGNALAILRDCEIWIASTARVGTKFASSPGEQSSVDSCKSPEQSPR